MSAPAPSSAPRRLAPHAAVGVATAAAAAHFVVAPALHGLLADRGVDRAEYVQSALTIAAYLLGAGAVLAGAVRTVLGLDSAASSGGASRGVLGLRAAIAGMAPAVLFGAGGAFFQRVPPLVVTLYAAVSAGALLLAAALAARSVTARGPALVAAPVAVAALLRLLTERIVSASVTLAAPGLFSLAVGAAALASAAFAGALVAALFWGIRRGATLPAKIALHSALALGFALAWAALRGLSERATPGFVALAAGLDRAVVALQAGPLLTVGRLAAAIALPLAAAFAFVAPLSRRGEGRGLVPTAGGIAVAAALVTLGRVDAPFGAAFALVAAFALFDEADVLDWGSLLATRPPPNARVADPEPPEPLSERP